MHNVCVIVTFTIVYNVAFLSAFTLLICFYMKTCMVGTYPIKQQNKFRWYQFCQHMPTLTCKSSYNFYHNLRRMVIMFEVVSPL